ncbi:MAG: nicotinate-nucleotide--dimethylbenzimidazole phosphoribosyltransferase [Elusimicrobia bacterium]|nr:nicotinate-nucleotide--dimethylbenzimidazole phosphoribosyltransferase [Candidatus Liberimonas magnetica]
MLYETTKKIKDLDEKSMQNAQKRLDNLTKPQGSLGRLEELAKQVAGITGMISPKLDNKLIITIAGDHGVVEEGVSAFPKEVTPQMVHNFLRGGAGINVLARHIGAKVVVVDAGVASDIKPELGLIINKVGYGTRNMAKGPAMTKEEAVKAIECGISIVEMNSSVSIIGTGDMGIGNTTASSAIVASITGQSVDKVTGKGTGIDDKTLNHKIAVIKKALDINKPNVKDGIDVLSKVGGFEIGAIAGVILGAASKKIPVVIDGFISGAGALIAYLIEPKSKYYMIASHCSVEQGHKIALDFIGLKPLFNLDMRLGEGTGAALGISLVEASVKILNEMSTFESAGVSEKEK